MIHVFLGTKAQLIKMAPIMRELQNRGIDYNFIFSGQHQATIDELMKNFGVKEPDSILHSGSDITSIPKMFFWLVKIIVGALINRKKIWRGDSRGLVINHGDTFSTLAGSILARLAGHKCAHVESGLRSYDMFNPFPEELTRIAVFNLSNIFFAPDEWAGKNLKKYKGEKVITGGNTLYDSLQTIKLLDAPADLIFPSQKYCLVSFHRFENIFKKSQLIKIVEIVEKISVSLPVLVIMHKPTLNRLVKAGLMNRLRENQNIELRPRYDYHKFIHLVMRAEFIVTDGGSNQEECFYLGKPCLIIRETTERQEGLGENALLGKFNHEDILNFTENYHKYNRKEVLMEPSPTTTIVNYIADA